MVRKYLIIGTGPAGIAAAETVKDQDPNGDLTLIGEDFHGFYSRPGLAYFLTGEISQRELFFRRSMDFKQIKKRAAVVDAAAHRVVTADGKSYNYDRLLLATGSKATRLTIAGAGLSGVVTLDDMDDAQQILRILQGGGPGVVVGGGITALEIVEALIGRGIETHYLLRGDRYWPGVLDEVESAVVEARLKSAGVRLHHYCELTEICGAGGRVNAIRTAGGERIPCRLVAVAIGVRPQVDLAAAAGLRIDRGILTDQYMRTSAEDIFAAGDVAQVYDAFCGEFVLDTLWSKALAQGSAAGRNMVGDRTPYYKEAAFNVTRLAGLTTTIIGSVGRGKDIDLLSITRGDSETWRHLQDVVSVQRDFDVNRTRVMVGPKTLTGAVVMGDQTLSRPLHRIIAARADITPIRPELLAPGAPLADIMVHFWTDWSRQNVNS